jgi:hypothetical protein
MNVGLGTVKSARTVIDHGVPEPVREVEQDRVSVSAAAEIARLPEQQQRAIVADGPKVVQVIARDLREQRTTRPEAARASPHDVPTSGDHLPARLGLSAIGGRAY